MRHPRPGRSWLLGAGLALVAPTSAHAGFDGTGQPIPVDSDNVADPLLTWRATRPARGALSFAALFELAADPLVRLRVDAGDGSVQRERVVGSLAGFRLGGRAAVTDRIEVAVSLPVWLAATSEVAGHGAAIGDLVVSAPIGLAAVDVAGVGVAGAVVPQVHLPTGPEDRFLGDAGPLLGVQGVGEASLGPVVLAGSLGVDLRFFRAEDNYRSGPGVRGSLSAGVRLDPRFGLHLGWRADSRLLAGDVEDPDAPRRVGASELAISGRGVLFDRWYSTFGLSTFTQQGPGAAAARLWLGLGKSLGGQAPVVGIASRTLTVEVHDPDGAVVSGAQVSLGDEVLGTTDAAGLVDLTRRFRSGERLVVASEGFVDGIIEDPTALFEVVDGETATSGRTRVDLAWAPVPVRVRVQDAEGRSLVSQVSAISPAGASAPSQVEHRGGMAELDVAPGTWMIQARTEGYGVQRRGVILEPRGAGEELRFILLPELGSREVEISVVDVNGDPVAGAELDIAGQPIGTTGSGGVVQVGGLGSEKLVVDAQADTFRGLTTPDVSPGDAPVELVLARERGAVQVVVRGADGRPVTDASARLLGADRLGPFPIGDDGERTFVLRPGPWQLLVSSPEHGLQQRALEIAERDTGMQIVEIVLQPPELGATDLTVRVVDAENNPVPQASIALDGTAYGTTSSGGELAVDGLREGPRTLQVTGDWLVPLEEPLLLAGGLQEHTVVASYKPGTTLVLARGPSGMVDDASARFVGPARLPVLALGRDGSAITQLAAGAWQVLVSSPTHGAQQQGVAIPADSRTLHVVEAVLDPGEAGSGRLTVEVVDPRGRPVPGARIALDGNELGTTASSGTVSLVELATGPRQLSVVHPPYAPARVRVAVGTKEATQLVQLGWGVGAVEVTVTGGDGLPAEDARLRLGGARFVPATPVDPDGKRLFALEPGDWQLLASASRFTPAQVAFEVPGTPGLTEIGVELGQPVAGVSEVLVRVQNPDGEPVSGALVTLDEDEPVAAGDGGLAVLRGAPGTHTIGVSAPAFVPATFEDVELAEGVNERIFPLAWQPRRVRVEVVGPDGPVTGAEVRLVGPADVAPALTSGEGVAVIPVRPGRWQVLASAPELGTKAANLVVPERVDEEDPVIRLVLADAQVEVSGGLVRIEDTIYFDLGKATLKPASTPILDEVAATLQAHPELVRLVVEGHTDTTGGVTFNLQLSRDRARAVVDALVARGVAPERLLARGLGPTRPVADNETEAGRAANRRVELHGEVAED